MKQLHLLGSAAVVGLTVLAGTSVLAHGGHSGGHHSGGHHSSSHHSGGHHHSGGPHHSTAHHSAAHHSAPHHSRAHVAGVHHGTSHSYAQHGYHHWGHHSGWNNGNWNYGGSWYGGPGGVWDGSVASEPVVPWYYESFFNVEPEAAVLPENGPIVSRGYRNPTSMPTSPVCPPSATAPEEPVVAGSDGN